MREQHTTADEVQFVENIGTYADSAHREKAKRWLPLRRRLGLLKKYKESIPRRSSWDGISRQEVEEKVDSLIKMIERHLQKD